MRTLVGLILSIALLTAGAAFARPDGAPPGTGWTPKENILGHLEQVADLNRFADLLRLTDLATTLRGPGPFTVFAPTNEAFSYMPAKMLEDLALPRNKAQLTKILGCHIVPGKVVLLHLRLTPATGGHPLVLRSVTGCVLTLRSSNGALFVDDANGITAAVGRSDIGESNGYVNEIDGVLTPGIAKP